MYTIATLHHLRRSLGLADADTSEDVRLMDALRAASAQIERAAGRHFLPRRTALIHRVGIDETELLLDDDLLELTSVEDANGTIPLEDVELLPANGPASVLLMKNGRFFTAGETGVTVTGVWGWHDDWTQAWRSSSDSVADDPLSSTTITVSVQDADGLDGEFEAPRFQVGQLLAIEAEYLRVIRVDTTLNRLYTQRGVGGTESVSHLHFTNILVYQPPRDVHDLTTRWAAYLYKQGGPVPELFYESLASLRRERV
jgi:hypothetical protein